MPIGEARRKYNALRKAGFLPFEAKEFIRTSRMTEKGKIKVTPPPLTIPYIKEMIRSRAKALRQAQREGVPIQDYINSIEDFYRDESFLDADGSPDFWQYFRDIRDKAIDRGEYVPPLKKKPRPLDKGDVKAQKARYRAKQKAKPPPVGEVIFNPKTGRYEAVIY